MGLIISCSMGALLSTQFLLVIFSDFSIAEYYCQLNPLPVRNVILVGSVEGEDVVNL